MNNDIKERLKSVCTVPDPKRKDSFLKDHRKKEISIKELYIIQFSYIAPVIWIFGIVHSIILIMLSLLSSLNSIYSLVYLLVPYLITSNTSSILLRHYHGKSVLLGCLANSFFVSMVLFVLSKKSHHLYSAVMFPYWVVVLVLMLLLGIWNIFISLKRTECFYGFGN